MRYQSTEYGMWTACPRKNHYLKKDAEATRLGAKHVLGKKAQRDLGMFSDVSKLNLMACGMLRGEKTGTYHPNC